MSVIEHALTHKGRLTKTNCPRTIYEI